MTGATTVSSGSAGVNVNKAPARKKANGAVIGGSVGGAVAFIVLCVILVFVFVGASSKSKTTSRRRRVSDYSVSSDSDSDSGPDFTVTETVIEEPIYAEVDEVVGY